MNPPIIIQRAKPKRIRQMDTPTTEAFSFVSDKKKREHTIVIPYRASTKTRLHEIAHCELGHCIENDKTRNKKMPISTYLDQEFAAEEYAYSRCNKTISMETVNNYAHSLIVDFKCSHVCVFNACIKALAKHYYILDKEQRSELWWACRDFEKERRKY